MSYVSQSVDATDDDAPSTDTLGVSEDAQDSPLVRAFFFVVVYVATALVLCIIIFFMVSLMAPPAFEPAGNMASPAHSTPTATPEPSSRIRGYLDTLHTNRSHFRGSLNDSKSEHRVGASTESLTAVSRKKIAYCETEDCLTVARYYKQSFAIRGDPCYDAYLYACGSETLNVISDLLGVMTGGISRVFKTGTVPRRKQSAHQKALAFYRSCTKRNQQSNENFLFVRSFLSKVGLTIHADNRSDPMEITLRLALRYGINVFFIFSLRHTRVVGDRFVINIETAEEFAGWRRTKPKVAANFPQYLSYLKDILTKLGVVDDRDIRDVARSIQSAEKIIFKICDENHVEDAHSLLMRDFVENEALKPRWVAGLSTHSDGELPGDYIVDCPVYVRKFVDSAFSLVPCSDLNLYIAFGVARQLLAASGLIKPAVDSHRDECYVETERLWKHAVANPFLMSVVNASRIKGALDMAVNIKYKIEKNMRYTAWLDPHTKATLLKKLQDIRFQIGFPKGLSTPQHVEAYYEHYPDISGPFLKSYLDASCSHSTTFFKVLATRPADAFSLNFNYVDIGAHYQPQENAVVVPAGSLLSPHYNYGAPPEVNYAHLGKTFSHELMHAFDENFRMYDENGAIVKWSDDSEERYQKRKQCLSGALSNATLNIRNKENEYLADNLASKSLYEAYKEAQKKSTSAIRGLESLSPDQVFFLGQCFMFCAPGRQAFSNTHPDNPQRCNVPLANLPEYAVAFQCPVGSPQNPDRKCLLW